MSLAHPTLPGETVRNGQQSVIAVDIIAAEAPQTFAQAVVEVDGY